jgi:hypothetical protein
MAALLLLATLLMISGGVSAFNVMGYANVQYTILYYQYRDLSFQTYPFMGHPFLVLLMVFFREFFGIYWKLMLLKIS